MRGYKSEITGRASTRRDKLARQSSAIDIQIITQESGVKYSASRRSYGHSLRYPMNKSILADEGGNKVRSAGDTLLKRGYSDYAVACQPSSITSSSLHLQSFPTHQNIHTASRSPIYAPQPLQHPFQQYRRPATKPLPPIRRPPTSDRTTCSPLFILWVLREQRLYLRIYSAEKSRAVFRVIHPVSDVAHATGVFHKKGLHKAAG